MRSNKCGVFACPTCNEDDPHCEHGVNLAVADCAQCDAVAAERTAEMREALVEFYALKAAQVRADIEEFELMGRTVRALRFLHEGRGGAQTLTGVELAAGRWATKTARKRTSLFLEG